MGSLYTHRNRPQARASARGRRRKKNFPLHAEKAAWRRIHATEATLELPALPLPTQRAVWLALCSVAIEFWTDAGSDSRVSERFRKICRANAQRLRDVAARV